MTPVRMDRAWACVTCGRVEDGGQPLWTAGWLNLPGGRLCGGCQERFKQKGPGARAHLGHGCWLVMAEGK